MHQDELPVLDAEKEPRFSAGWATARNNILSKGGINEDRLYTCELLERQSREGVRLFCIFDGSFSEGDTYFRF